MKLRTAMLGLLVGYGCEVVECFLLDLCLVHEVVELDDGHCGAILDALSKFLGDEDDVTVVCTTASNVTAERLDVDAVCLGNGLNVHPEHERRATSESAHGLYLWLLHDCLPFRPFDCGR